MVGLYVAATVVTLMLFVRRRERRLLPLLALFAFLALARHLDRGDPWAAVFEVGAVASGLALLAMLTPRHTVIR